MTDIHIGAKVRLRDGLSDVYRHAPEGAIGKVKDKRIDDSGFDLVYVEWSDVPPHKEPDGWTFAEHFYTITPPRGLLATFADPEEKERASQEEYVNLLLRALDVAGESSAFFVMAIKKTEGDGIDAYEPHGFAMARDEASGMLLEAQMIQMAADAHQHAVLRTIEFLRREEE